MRIMSVVWDEKKERFNVCNRIKNVVESCLDVYFSVEPGGRIMMDKECVEKIGDEYRVFVEYEKDNGKIGSIDRFTKQEKETEDVLVLFDVQNCPLEIGDVRENGAKKVFEHAFILDRKTSLSSLNNRPSFYKIAANKQISVNYLKTGKKAFSLTNHHGNLTLYSTH